MTDDSSKIKNSTDLRCVHLQWNVQYKTLCTFDTARRAALRTQRHFDFSVRTLRCLQLIIPIIRNKLTQSPMSFFRVVLTGGPCGGKSSSLKSLREKLLSKGYRVMTMPEVPTILMSNGASFPGIDGPREKLLQYESLLVNLQLNMEDSFKNFLSIDSEDDGLPGVLICDRAAPDTAAYLHHEVWEELLISMSLTQSGLMSRYDIVCHLVTTANGANEYYTAENNSVRTETPSEARALDLRTQACWVGHPCHKVFENIPGQDFSGKLSSVTNHILEQLEARQ